MFFQKLKISLENTEKPSKPISSETLTRLKALSKYTDIRLNLVKDITTLLKEKGSKKTELSETWMKNTLRVVGCLVSKENFSLDKFLNEKDPGADATLEDNYAEFKKRFSELWTEVMKWKMTPSVHKEVVILIPDRIMIHLTKPLHMSHFLLESFKMGIKNKISHIAQ